MTVIDGDTGIDKHQDKSVTQADLADNVATTGPAFSAYMTTSQSIAGGAPGTVVNFTAVEFDTAGCFDTAQKRFTPNVAGYYQFNFLVNANGYTGRFTVALYKNGAVAKSGLSNTGNNTNSDGSGGTALVYLGVSDYVDVRADCNNTTLTNSGPSETYFQAYLVRKA